MEWKQQEAVMKAIDNGIKVEVDWRGPGLKVIGYKYHKEYEELDLILDVGKFLDPVTVPASRVKLSYLEKPVDGTDNRL